MVGIQSKEKVTYNVSADMDLLNSYGSVNSDTIEVIRPGVVASVNFEEQNTIGTKIRRLFYGRVDSLTLPPRLEDDHVIRFTEFSVWQLFLFSLKYAIWIFLTTMPTILIVCLITYGYSYIPWTNECTQTTNGTYTEPCKYYSKQYLVYFDLVVRLILMAVIPVIVSTIAITEHRNPMKALLFISVPATTVILSCIPGFLKIRHLWFYYTDIILFIVVFLLALLSSLLFISQNNPIVKFKDLILYCFLPSILAAIGVGFLDAVVNKEYQDMEKNSISQYFVRIIVYPIIIDFLMCLGEFSIRKIPHNGKNNRSHAIYFYQVTFAVIGRFMTTVSGYLGDVVIMAATIAVKDFIFHRLSRPQCWLAFHFRKGLKRLFPNFKNDDIDKFEDWFFSKEFTSFKACVLNNEFTTELSGVIVVPFVMSVFNKHRMLFYFQDYSFRLQDGSLNYSYILLQAGVQLIFIFITIIVITMLEAKYNRVNLKQVYNSKLSVLEYISQTLIQFWSVLLLLSSIRMTTNYLQCSDSSNVCSCRMTYVDLKSYGCV